MLNSFRELDVWKQSLVLVTDIYRVTAKLPASERFGLISQLRRAAVSVPCNVAEGYGRATRGEYLNQLSVARGSINEVEALCEVCKALGFLDDGDLNAISENIVRVRQMLGRLREALKKTQRSRRAR